MISHHYKFIFVHIPKTGGISISALLGKYAVAPRRLLTGDDYWTDIHGKYYHYIQQYGQETWDNYYKFTFVRNPWSRLVSAFFYLNEGGNNPFDLGLSNMYIKKYKGDFSRFVNDFVAADKIKDVFHTHPQYEFIYDPEERLLVDFVGKFENMQEDFDKLCDHFGVPHTPVPHKNKTQYRNVRHYAQYYDDKTREIVADKYAKDIQLFGYKFE